MTANAITDLLSAPLGPDWTIDGLAEKLLGTIAAQPDHEFVLDDVATTNRQSQRLIRPLLACLATMSAAESGTPDDVFGGELRFERQGPEGPVKITGRFENTQGHVQLAFRRALSKLTEDAKQKPGDGNAGGAAAQFISSPGPTHGAGTKRSSPKQIDHTGKRWLAERWAESYIQSAPVETATTHYGAFAGVTAIHGQPHSHSLTMCLEIGRIYRGDWTRQDAERLVIALRLRDHARTSDAIASGAALGYFLIGGMGAIFGALRGFLFGADATGDSSLQSMANKIINHFESLA